MYLKPDLIRGVATLEGDNLVVALLSVHLKSGLIKEVAFGESGLIRGRLL